MLCLLSTGAVQQATRRRQEALDFFSSLIDLTALSLPAALQKLGLGATRCDSLTEALLPSKLSEQLGNKLLIVYVNRLSQMWFSTKTDE